MTKYLVLTAVLFAAALSARAQDAASSIPVALSTADYAPSPAPKAPEAAPATETSDGPTAAQRLAAEWTSLKASSQDSTKGSPAAAADELAAFIQRHPDALMTEEAQALLASLYESQGDYRSALIAWLRLLYEWPDSEQALRAQSEVLAIGDKELSRKVRPALSTLVKGSPAPDKADRLAMLLERVAEGLGDAVYEPALQEFLRFKARFPDYPKAARLQWNLARLHQNASKYAAALVAYRALIAVYPDSPYCPQAQLIIGRIYADNIRDADKAIEAYQELAAKYPDNTSVQFALGQTSELLSGKRQYELAVQTDEKIVHGYPKSPGALRAFNDEAKLLRDKLSKPADAISALRRLTEQFSGPDAVQALRDAADIARSDLKDYKQEIELRTKIGEDYSTDNAAAYELYDAGEIYEDDLKDSDNALKLYQETATKFPDTKYGRKAADRAAKLQKSKAG